MNEKYKGIKRFQKYFVTIIMAVMMTGMMLLKFASRIFNLISERMLIEKNICAYAKVTFSYLKAKKVFF